MTKKLTLSRAKKILRIVPASKSFWLCTNDYLRSLNTLALTLEDSTDDVFRYHVDKYKNDFSTWVKDIVDDKDLAREISRIKTRYTLVRKLRENVDDAKTILKRYNKAKSAIKTNKAKPKVRAIHKAAHDSRKAKKTVRQAKRPHKKR